MAVNLSPPSVLLPVKGVKLSTVATGMRYQGRDDLLLMTFVEGTQCAAVFTQNKCCAAPVHVAREHLNVNAGARAILVNAGNANAATGDVGMQNAITSCAAVAEKCGVTAAQVLPFSTGVIGEQMNMPVLLDGIESLSQRLKEDAWLDAAEAIMTTDTLAKACSKQVDVGGTTITITGIAKGSGMMCPNMATMLAYVATDANIDAGDLQTLVKEGAAASFNRITVDGDTSTNDALLLAATAQANTSALKGKDLGLVATAINEVLISLATAIVRDAEGATKFVKIDVCGGASEADCAAVAYSIGHSPLVKTALFASDPNWGRILMALGKAPADQLEIDQVDIKIGDVELIEQGQPASNYTEERGKHVFEQSEISISIDLNLGDSRYHVWTSDLSHDYVSINADYRS